MLNRQAERPASTKENNSLAVLGLGGARYGQRTQRSGEEMVRSLSSLSVM